MDADALSHGFLQLYFFEYLKNVICVYVCVCVCVCVFDYSVLYKR